MSPLHHFTVLVHVLSAVVWLGGMIAFALLAPVMRDIRDDSIRQKLFHDLGRRFRTIGWICAGLLLVTGMVQLRLSGWWGMDVLGSEGFWQTALGGTLFGKLASVTVMVVVQLVHDFWLGPKAGAVEAGTDLARSLRRRAALLARTNAFVGLVLLYFAVSLARGL